MHICGREGGDIVVDYFETLEKEDELIGLLSEYNIVVHEKDDENYNYLEEESKCITILNAKNEEDVYIDLEDEFTLSMNGYHAHYQPYEEDYLEMVGTLKDYLEGHFCVVLLFTNKVDGELQWRLSSIYESSICEFVKRKGVCNALGLGNELRKDLKQMGGKLYIYFFNAIRNEEIEIKKDV